MPHSQLDLHLATSLIEDDRELIKLCNLQRSSLSQPPTQSSFRVYALLFFLTDDIPGLQLVEGTNTEPSYIGGSICAERSALSKLRMFSNPKLVKLIVTTDAREPISPGLLCREFLFSHATDASLSIVFGDGESEKVVTCTIGELYPFPYIYRSILGDKIGDFGRALTCPGFKIESSSFVNSDDIQECYTMAFQATVNDKSPIHPLRLGACVQYADGSRDVAWQLKGLEYGCTIDPVCQLIRGMVLKTPKLLVMCDQYGVAHAPFAQARALLCEHGFGQLIICVHTLSADIERVLTPCLTTAAALAPSPTGRLLAPEDLSNTQH